MRVVANANEKSAVGIATRMREKGAFLSLLFRCRSCINDYLAKRDRVRPHPGDAGGAAARGAAQLARGVGRADGDVDSSGVHGGGHGRRGGCVRGRNDEVP